MATSVLASRIASEIIGMISAGELGRDAHVNTLKLAEHFHVSRSPIREALRELAERGILQLRENRGYFVGGKRSKIRKPSTTDPRNDGPKGYYNFAEDWLRDAVPGDVTEALLRDRYALTKAQVSEVLNRASREGWAERKPGYGWRLLPVAKTPEALEEIYRFRAVIEPAALLETTFAFDRKVIGALRRQQQRLLDGDIERLPAVRLLMLGVEVHEAIIRLSRNPFFIQALERVNHLRRLIDYRSMIDRKRYYSQCAEHIAILDLIDRGDNLGASHLMRRHLSGALERKSPFHRASSRRP